MTDLVHRLRTACSPESPLGKLCSEAASVLDEQINRQMHRAFIAGWMRYDTSRDVAIERGNQEFEVWYCEPAPAQRDAEPFQQEVDRWLIACFGEEIARDRVERNHRFLEEALETVQAGGCTTSEAHQLVDYVFARPVGELHQEVGGVMNTLAALCLAYDLDMVECGKVEIARCWTKVEKIRAKQAAKPKHSPLPEYAPTTPDAAATIARLERRVAEAERVMTEILEPDWVENCLDPQRPARLAKKWLEDNHA